jgi:glucokinase
VELLSTIPVRVIRDERAGVLGAARYASLALAKAL